MRDLQEVEGMMGIEHEIGISSLFILDIHPSGQNLQILYLELFSIILSKLDSQFDQRLILCAEEHPVLIADDVVGDLDSLASSDDVLLPEIDDLRQL